MIIEEYKGYRIQYSEDKDEWFCGEFEIKRDSLKAVKKAITKVLSDEVKSLGIKVLIESYGSKSGYEVVNITAFDNDPNYKGSKAAWVKDEKGSRQKLHMQYLYAYSKANLNRVQKLEELNKEIEKLEKKKERITDSMIYYNRPEKKKA